MEQAYEEGLCLGCKYPLRGLTSHRCPECGRPFDPAAPATYYSGRPRVLPRKPALWLVPGSCALAIGLLLLDMEVGSSELGMLLVWLTCFIIIAVIYLGRPVDQRAALPGYQPPPGEKKAEAKRRWKA